MNCDICDKPQRHLREKEILCCSECGELATLLVCLSCFKEIIKPHAKVTCNDCKKKEGLREQDSKKPACICPLCKMGIPRQQVPNCSKVMYADLEKEHGDKPYYNELITELKKGNMVGLENGQVIKWKGKQDSD